MSEVKMGSLEWTAQLSGNHSRLQTWRSSDRVPGGNYESSPYRFCSLQHIFGWCDCHNLSKKTWASIQVSFVVSQHRWSSDPQPLHQHADGSTTLLPVYWLYHNTCEFLLYIEATDYRSNFAKTMFFENSSCFSKIPFSILVESHRIFQCLISIPAGHWVRQIDSDLPRRFFLSALLSLVISMTGRSERSARALRDGADVVRKAIGK